MQRLGLGSLNKHAALRNYSIKTSIYYMWKNIRQHNKNKLKTKAPSWNDEFELPNGSY